jgi:hypothetical protein
VIRPGATWGEPYDPASSPPIVDVVGGDAALAAAAGPDVVLRFAPGADSDLGRALGLAGESQDRGAPTAVVPCDVLDLGHGVTAVNMAVLGVAPDRLGWWHRARSVTVEADGRSVGEGRATSVVVASGQYLRGRDLVPRSHPGDGRLEVQVYDVAPGERRALRARLLRGDHLPHPKIAQVSARRVVVRWGRGPVALEVDGRRLAPADRVEIVVRPAGARVLV